MAGLSVDSVMWGYEQTSAPLAPAWDQKAWHLSSRDKDSLRRRRRRSPQLRKALTRQRPLHTAVLMVATKFKSKKCTKLKLLQSLPQGNFIVLLV
eukprot:1008715-Amphidinium_carterae.1